MKQTIKTLCSKARVHAQASRLNRKLGIMDLAEWHEGMKEGFMTSARIVKHDAYQSIDAIF